MSLSSLSNKTYIVTGGGSGIGLETTRKLLTANAVVHVIEQKDSLPEELANSAKQVHFHGPVDVSSRSEVTQVFKAISATSPVIDGLVNSAGICPGGEGYLISDESYHRTMAVNVTGTWNVTTAFLEMINRDSPTNNRDSSTASKTHASIVNLGSSASICAWPTLVAYTASKHAVLGLTRSWSLDWAHKGIRVNLVAPGGTDTPLARAQLSDAAGRGEALTAGLAQIPLGRLGRPEEQADAIIFLLSENSSYITGQVIPVNGGYP